MQRIWIIIIWWRIWLSVQYEISMKGFDIVWMRHTKKPGAYHIYHSNCNNCMFHFHTRLFLTWDSGFFFVLCSHILENKCFFRECELFLFFLLSQPYAENVFESEFSVTRHNVLRRNFIYAIALKMRYMQCWSGILFRFRHIFRNCNYYYSCCVENRYWKKRRLFFRLTHIILYVLHQLVFHLILQKKWTCFNFISPML